MTEISHGNLIVWQRPQSILATWRFSVSLRDDGLVGQVSERNGYASAVKAGPERADQRQRSRRASVGVIYSGCLPNTSDQPTPASWKHHPKTLAKPERWRKVRGNLGIWVGMWGGFLAGNSTDG